MNTSARLIVGFLSYLIIRINLLRATSLFPKETSTLLDIGMKVQGIWRNAHLTLNSREVTSVHGRKLFIVYVRFPRLCAPQSLQSARTAEHMKDWGSTASNKSSKQSKKTLLSLVRSIEDQIPSLCAELELAGHVWKANNVFAHYLVDWL